MKFRLERVDFMPTELKAGVLYFAEEYGAAAHLCACGCGSKVRTPIDETEWALEDDADGPSLFPSVGNWQKPCRSHYIVYRGEVIWCERWSDEDIEEGRRNCHERRLAHLSQKDPQKRPPAVLEWLRRFVR